MADAPEGPESISASRQKSCNACVKAKRGCDKRHPVCSRCNERNILCIYTKRTYTEAFQYGFDFDATEFDTYWAGVDSPSPSLSINQVDGIPPRPATSASLDTTRSPLHYASINPFLTLTETHTSSSSDLQLISSANGQSRQQQEKDLPINKFDYSRMADICMKYEPWQVYDPNSKVHFIVQTLQTYPSTFAKDNNTPWMHRYLYKDQMPTSIQSCLTACALYSNMTTSNKSSVIRVLCQSLNELRQQHLVNTPQEKLARVQALFLYLIICVFDGDITLRTYADRDMLLLKEWIDELCKVRENLGKPESISSVDMKGDLTPPRSWEWWIFSESVRRTTLIAYAFGGLWNLLCKSEDESFFGAWRYSHYWTLSRLLWEAPSSFDFFLTWKSKPHHVIENFDMETFLKTGTADEVDNFSKLFIVTYMGLDKTKEWFMDKGSIF